MESLVEVEIKIKEHELLMDGKYILTKELLGEGNFGKVFKGIKVDEQKEIAIKWGFNSKRISYEEIEIYKELSMKENGYFLQAALYTEAIKNYLSIVDSRPFTEIFGGVFYLFLRGLSQPSYGVYHFIQ